MKILVTNDDGYRAKGLKSLINVMKRFGDVTVIAPKKPQSAVALSVTMGYQPIAVKELGTIDGVRWLYVDGTPASCVKFAIDNVFTDGKPDIVVSGVNHGSNAATAACYSATLGSVEEAAINRIPGIGVSLDSFDPDADFSAVEALLPDIIVRLLDSLDTRYGTYYNVNFPNLPISRIKGVRVCHMGIGHWEKEFEDWNPDAIAARGVVLEDYGIDPEKVVREEGEALYYMAGHFVDDPLNVDGADHRLMKSGYVTLVTHNVDNTDYNDIDRLKRSGFDMDFQ